MPRARTAGQTKHSWRRTRGNARPAFETAARRGNASAALLRSFTADRGVCRLLRFPRDGGCFVEAAAEGEVQVDALDQTFDLHPHERHLRRVQRKLLLLDATQIARPYAKAHTGEIE